MSYQLYQGDCLEVMKQIPDGSVDLVLTDPPYGMALKPQRGSSKFKGVEIAGDKSLEWLPAYADELHRVANNVILSFVDWAHLRDFQTEYERVGFKIKNVIVWHKDWFGMGNNFRPNYELCILACKTNVVTKSNNLSNVLKVRRLSPQKMTHVAEKPVALLEILIKELTNEGASILDTFMGTGSTGVACANTGRNFIGIEQDAKYFEIAKARIESASLAKAA
jgi:site-specific DNA-methyltransferase (adenine-specific)